MKVLLALSVVLIVFAAGGLSQGMPFDGYCGPHAQERMYWPPGTHCAVEPGAGHGYFRPPDTGSAGVFFAILAAGLALVLARRSKLAVATGIVFGFAGLIAFFVSPVAAELVALFYAGTLALVVTRSIPATLLAIGAFSVAWAAQFWDHMPWLYAIVLLALAASPQTTEVRQMTALSH